MWVGLALVVLVFGMGRLPEFFSASRPQYDHLGGEYYNVARAIAEGRGFSDPFADSTGPTAWVSPSFTWLLTLFVVVFKTRLRVATAMFYVMNVAYVGIGLSIYRTAARYRSRVSALVCVALYVGWLATFYDWFFLLTHDIWFVAALSEGIFVAALHQIVNRRVTPWRWGVLGGVVALSNPALTVAWAGLSGFVAFRLRSRYRSVVSAALIAGAIAAPWAVRNALRFDGPPVVKSNVFFEAYQANCVDDDGVYDTRTLSSHPYNSPALRYEYAQMGEARFLGKYREVFMHSFVRTPSEYARRVWNRSVAATVRHVPLTPEDLVPARAIERIVYPIPFIGLVLSLCFRKRERDVVTSAAVFYALYLVPYVFIAFYERYLFGVTPVLVLLAFLGVDALIAHSAPDSRSQLVRGTCSPAVRSAPEAAPASRGQES